MSKPQDGLVSRFLNRPISRFVSTHFLLKLPIHPNAWTISIFLLPVIASLFLVRGDYVAIVIGAALFQLYSILDGCDGEIARAKNLESKFGERLDNLCDVLGSLLFVIALGIGLERTAFESPHGWSYRNEGIACAAFIALNEMLLQLIPARAAVDSGDLSKTLYPRHRAMIEHSGISLLGERFTWWLMQLTKRDVAILVFLLLALLGRAEWILHLWITVSLVSLVMSGIAASRSRRRVTCARRCCSATASMSALSTSCHHASPISMTRALPSVAMLRTPSDKLQSPSRFAFSRCSKISAGQTNIPVSTAS